MPDSARLRCLVLSSDAEGRGSVASNPALPSPPPKGPTLQTHRACSRQSASHSTRITSQLLTCSPHSIPSTHPLSLCPRPLTAHIQGLQQAVSLALDTPLKASMAWQMLTSLTFIPSHTCAHTQGLQQAVGLAVMTYLLPMIVLEHALAHLSSFYPILRPSLCTHRACSRQLASR